MIVKEIYDFLKFLVNCEVWGGMIKINVMKKIRWAHVGLFVYLLMFLISTILASGAGGYVDYYVIMILPLMLPLTMGSKKQKILACCFLTFTLLLILNDNQAGKANILKFMSKNNKSTSKQNK